MSATEAESSASDWAEIARLLKAGELDEAEAALSIVSRADPQSLKASLLRARIAWARGQAEQAALLLRRAASNHPKAGAVHATLADLYMELDRPELALEAVAAADRAELNDAGRTIVERVRMEAHERLFGWETSSTGSRALDADSLGEGRSTDPAPAHATEPMPRLSREPLTQLTAAPALVPRGMGPERAQVHLLLGGDLFESGPEATRIWAARRPRRTDLARRIERGAFLAFVASFVVGGASLLTVGVEQQAKAVVDTSAQDLLHLLQNGSLAHAASLLASMEEAARTAGKTPEREDLFALAHALIWRFHDDSLEHLAGAKVAEGEATTPSLERRLARATLAIEARPEAVLRDLGELAKTEPSSPHPALLVALAACKLRDRPLAEASFARAEALEPPHLPYLYAQLNHWLGVRDVHAASDALDRMRDVNPKSAWTRLAEARVEGLDVAALASDPEAPPVVRRIARTLGAK